MGVPGNSTVVSWEPEGRYCRSKMFHWEPEGRYCHRLGGVDSALLVLNGTSLSCNNALLALNWRCAQSCCRAPSFTCLCIPCLGLHPRPPVLPSSRFTPVLSPWLITAITLQRSSLTSEIIRPTFTPNAPVRVNIHLFELITFPIR